MITIFLMFFLIIILIVYLIKDTIKPRNFPPGPSWVPFIGSSNKLFQLSKKYGSQSMALDVMANYYCTKVLGIKLGNELTIAVFGAKNIQRVFSGSEFEGRPDNYFVRLRCFGRKSGITLGDGPLWKIQRNFTVKKLRNVGFGKSTMEKQIQNELENILQILKSQCGNPFNPKKMLGTSVMNVLWKYVAGEFIEESSLQSLIDLLGARSKAFSMAGSWLNLFPWCRFIIPEMSGFALIQKINTQISSIIENTIDRHKNGLVSGQDFIYFYLEEMKTNPMNFTDEELRVVCMDLLIAGSQTTSNLLEFTLLRLMKEPEIQEKIYKEILTNIGNNIPTWTVNDRLVYTCAFIYEVHRYYSIVPLAGPRRVLKETEIDGYSIPKNTIVLIGLSNLNKDPEIWVNPQEFRPQRFIDETGNLKYPEYLYPFGLGKRRCPGDSLAKSFIFIILVGIIQKFKIHCYESSLVSDEPIIGLISTPREFNAEFILRR